MGDITAILSCNEDPTYLSFLRHTREAYKLLGFDCQVAVLTRHPNLYKERWVHCFEPVGHIPEFAQAKMIRFILASTYVGVNYVDDIDLIPLSKEFITNKTNQRPQGHLLCVGGEVYDNNGCYPVSQMTAEHTVWKEFINPKNLSHKDLFDQWTKEPYMFDRREDMGIKLDWSKDDYFSDERLLRRLTEQNPVPKFELPRGYTDYLDATIDRHTFDKETVRWIYDTDKLQKGGYMNVHGIRPFKEEHYKPFFDYLNSHKNL